MQASVRRFWLLRKTINRGNGTESLLRCCPIAGILHSERPAFACDCRSYGWVAQLAEQWTENPRVGGSIPPPAIFWSTHIEYRANLCRQMKYDWKDAGEEWSEPWGSSAAQWSGTILPRIRDFLPAGT